MPRYPARFSVYFFYREDFEAYSARLTVLLTSPVPEISPYKSKKAAYRLP
jgi:hypothetical protein